MVYHNYIIYFIQLPKHEELSIMVFERIMKNPDVLVEFVYVYDLGLQEIHLIKDMIHPDRNREHSETCLVVKILIHVYIISYIL